MKLYNDFFFFMCEVEKISPLVFFCRHFPSGSVSVNTSLPPVPARPRARWGPAAGLPGGRCWLTGSPATKRGVTWQQSQQKPCRKGPNAPVNPYAPGPVYRRPSCCSVPAAEPNHSPAWPLETGLASGSKWLCRCVGSSRGRCNTDGSMIMWQWHKLMLVGVYTCIYLLCTL